jgi:ubiquitin carboxyl-terminal hydrolase L3
MRTFFLLNHDTTAPTSTIDKLLKKCIPLSPEDRTLALEESRELEEAHTFAAKQGQSAVPERPEDDVPYHYVCFVCSHKNGRIYELDGMRAGPIDTGVALREGKDMLSEDGIGVIKAFMETQQRKGNLTSDNFNLMAVVKNS